MRRVFVYLVLAMPSFVCCWRMVWCDWPHSSGLAATLAVDTVQMSAREDLELRLASPHVRRLAVWCSPLELSSSPCRALHQLSRGSFDVGWNLFCWSGTGVCCDAPLGVLSVAVIYWYFMALGLSGFPKSVSGQRRLCSVCACSSASPFTHPHLAHTQ